MGVTAPVNIVSQAEYDEQEKPQEPDPFESDDKKLAREVGMFKGITQAMSDDYKARFGFDNWYNWRNHNWGTKWDLAPDDVNETWGGTYASFFFLTAWSPPEGIHKAIVRKFPNIKIGWHYSESGMGFSGNLETGEHFDYADETEESWQDYDEEEAKQFEVKQESKCYEEDKLNRKEKKGLDKKE
jgi:hypothetical protein